MFSELPARTTDNAAFIPLRSFGPRKMKDRLLLVLLYHLQYVVTHAQPSETHSRFLPHQTFCMHIFILPFVRILFISA